jgi:hypothetical protein
LDFLKILRSFEEFIFEAMTWLLFYPRTLWRIVRRPLQTMDYSDHEQSDPPEKQYDDALSPPLLLLFTVVLVNLLGIALHVPPPAEAPGAMKVIVASQQNLVLFRSLVFSLPPLVAAATLLGRQKVPLSREALRGPFYAQCYLAAPSAIFMGVGEIIFQRHDIPNLLGLTLMMAGAGWFLWAQTRWFASRLGVSLANAAVTAIWALARALIYLLLILIPISQL